MLWIKWVIDEVLNPIGVVIGIVTFVPVVLTWWAVTFGRQRQYQAWFSQVSQSAGMRPSILIVDLLEGKDIANSVERFRSGTDLKSVPPDRVFSLQRAKRLVPPDMPELTQELRTTVANIISAGTDTLHLFYAGPVVPMGLVGAELANACRVILYQHASGSYENWGPLRHDFAR